jgi:hypothetical protein
MGNMSFLVLLTFIILRRTIALLFQAERLGLQRNAAFCSKISNPATPRFLLMIIIKGVPKFIHQWYMTKYFDLAFLDAWKIPSRVI